MRWLALRLMLVAGDAFGAIVNGNELLGWYKEFEKYSEQLLLHAGRRHRRAAGAHRG